MDSRVRTLHLVSALRRRLDFYKLEAQIKIEAKEAERKIAVAKFDMIKYCFAAGLGAILALSVGVGNIVAARRPSSSSFSFMGKTEGGEKEGEGEEKKGEEKKKV